MRAVHKRYQIELFSAMGAYVVLLLGAVWVSRHIDSTGLRALVIVLPVLPLLLVIRAMLRVLRDQDELERRVDLESIAIGAAVTGIGFFTFGLLSGAQVVGHVDGEILGLWVWPILMFSYGCAKCFVVAPHYRGGAQ